MIAKTEKNNISKKTFFKYFDFQGKTTGSFFSYFYFQHGLKTKVQNSKEYSTNDSSNNTLE